MLESADLKTYRADLLALLAEFGQPEPAALELMEASARTERVAKDTLLCREGDICRELFFLHSGSARSYFHRDDGREITSWLSFENSFVATLPGLLHGQPAQDSIAILEDATITRIDYPRLEAAFDRFPGLLRLCYNLMAEYFLEVDERTTALQCNSAEERLRDLLARAPGIFERLPAYHIASYLGVSSETLSRVRTKFFRSTN